MKFLLGKLGLDYDLIKSTNQNKLIISISRLVFDRRGWPKDVDVFWTIKFKRYE